MHRRQFIPSGTERKFSTGDREIITMMREHSERMREEFEKRLNDEAEARAKADAATFTAIVRVMWAAVVRFFTQPVTLRKAR